MKQKLFLIFIAVVVGLCIASVTSAKQPPELPIEDPPIEGGLPECLADLGVCTSDLGVCTSDLGVCTSDLGVCTSDLGVCDENLLTCTSSLTEKTNLLDACNIALVDCEENGVMLPATGQTTCYTQAGESIDCSVEAGEDGYFQAGGSLAYIWNNDGTLVDVNTKLMWERKDMSGGIHDWRNTYRWVESFRQHIGALNNTCKSDETVDCSANGDADCEAALGAGEVCGFAGYRDWRMPNVKELITIIDYSGVFPPYSMSFNWFCEEGCSIMGETGCSCSNGWYWTSTTYIGTPPQDRAFFIDNGGQVSAGFDAFSDQYKYSELNVRAVRGGQGLLH